jgi:hypothetical protein
VTVDRVREGIRGQEGCLGRYDYDYDGVGSGAVGSGIGRKETQESNVESVARHGKPRCLLGCQSVSHAGVEAASRVESTSERMA